MLMPIPNALIEFDFFSDNSDECKRNGQDFSSTLWIRASTRTQCGPFPGWEKGRLRRRNSYLD
jgi:hypothetical protein